MSHKNVISITKKFEENNIKTKVEPRGKSVRSAYPKSWDQCGHPPLWNWIINMDHKVEKNCISILLIFRTCHSLYFIKNIKAYDCCKTRKSRSDRSGCPASGWTHGGLSLHVWSQTFWLNLFHHNHQYSMRKIYGWMRKLICFLQHFKEDWLLLLTSSIC